MKGKKLNRLFAIGDIHGDYESFEGVLSNMRKDGMNLYEDGLILMGDYIDGGPRSADVVAQIRELTEEFDEHVLPLFGNHEDLAYEGWWSFQTSIPSKIYNDAFRLWYTQGGQQTLASYGIDLNGEENTALFARFENDLEWLHNLPLAYETKNFIFVHAGLLPNMTVEGTPRNEKIWIREPFLSSSYDWGKIVVHGHTARKNVEVLRNRICIDTRRHKNGHVSGIEIHEPNVYTIYDGENKIRHDLYKERK
jgi:serine/threonine protein phosphatase 1